MLTAPALLLHLVRAGFTGFDAVSPFPQQVLAYSRSSAVKFLAAEDTSQHLFGGTGAISDVDDVNVAPFGALCLVSLGHRKVEGREERESERKARMLSGKNFREAGMSGGISK